MKTITTHYIDGAFVDSHGREVADSINPANGKVIGHVALGDEQDARLAIAAAKRAFESFSLTTKEERSAKRAIVEAASAFRVGDPADPQTLIGPMVTRRQYERIQSYISKGIADGAQVLVGGEGHPQGLEGCFVKPTVFVNVTNDMTIAQEEIFGPVLCVISYETEEEAIRIANDSRFGLHAYVSGTDLERARRVASRILAGRVVINGMIDDPQAPWGGFKHSGVGREYGAFGIEAFLEPRAIIEIVTTAA